MRTVEGQVIGMGRDFANGAARLAHHDEKFEEVEEWRRDVYQKVGELRIGRGWVFAIGGTIVSVVAAVVSALLIKAFGG